MKHTTLKICAIITLITGIAYLYSKIEPKQESSYKISACDWMMLKRQKIGSFELMKELGGDGVEMDMGSLGKRDTFDNKLRQEHFQKLFRDKSTEHGVTVSSVAMSGFYGQSFLRHNNYKALVEDCIATMKVMGAKVAFLPLGGIDEDWINDSSIRAQLVDRLKIAGDMAHREGLVIGLRTPLVSEAYITFLDLINSKGIKAYLNFQEIIENNRDICEEIKSMGKDRICQIHCTDTDGVNLPDNEKINMKEVKKTLDKMKWSG